MILLTDEEIERAYWSGEASEPIGGTKAIAKAQLKKVVDGALGMKWGREGKNLEVDLIKLGLFLVALLKEVED